jgi:hypothetical protein
MGDQGDQWGRRGTKGNQGGPTGTSPSVHAGGLWRPMCSLPPLPPPCKQFFFALQARKTRGWGSFEGLAISFFVVRFSCFVSFSFDRSSHFTFGYCSLANRVRLRRQRNAQEWQDLLLTGMAEVTFVPPIGNGQGCKNVIFQNLFEVEKRKKTCMSASPVCSLLHLFSSFDRGQISCSGTDENH